MPRGRKKKTIDVNQTSQKVAPPVFDIFAIDDELLRDSHNGLATLRAQKKNTPLGLASLSDIRRTMTPWPHFAWEWFTGNMGLPQGVMVDLIGKEGIGKTSLIHWLIGSFLRAGCPAYYQETENKPQHSSWVGRCMTTDPTKVKAYLARVKTEQHPPASLSESHRMIEEWVTYMRGKSPTAQPPFVVPPETPMFVAVDTWSKLMSPQEFEAYFGYLNPNLKKKKAGPERDIGDVSNMGHAKWNAGWCRVLPHFMNSNNVNLFVAHHQTTKQDWGQAGPFKLPESYTDLRNKTKIGGAAGDQLAAMQIIAAPYREIKDDSDMKKVVAKTVRLRMHKNSYGPPERIIEMDIKFEDLDDREDYQECPVSFDRFLAEKFAENGWLGTTMHGGKFTSAKLGVKSATAKEFCDAFHANTELRNFMGRQLGIQGYTSFETLVEERKQKEELANEEES
jgi:RecA/RadA recombinase